MQFHFYAHVVLATFLSFFKAMFYFLLSIENRPAGGVPTKQKKKEKKKK